MTQPGHAWKNSVDHHGRAEPRRAEAGGGSPKREPQAAGAAEGGGEDRQAPLVISRSLLPATATDGRRQRRRAAVKAQELIAADLRRSARSGPDRPMRTRGPDPVRCRGETNG